MKRDRKSAISPAQWFELVMQTFPELEGTEYDPSNPTQILTICEDLAYEVDEAQRQGTPNEFVARCYEFFRWSIHRADESDLKGWIADWFFDRIFDLPTSKEMCLEFLDWGDVRTITAAFTTEPSFRDASNFKRLSAEWKRRWSRNQKLPRPTEFAQQGV